MPRFMFLFVRLDDPDIHTQQKLGGEWLSSLAEGVVESSAAFEPDARLVTKDGNQDFRDVHFGGYMIVNADSLSHAVKIGQESPHAALGGRLLVRRIS
jgi:hypothetical protein